MRQLGETDDAGERVADAGLGVDLGLDGEPQDLEVYDATNGHRNALGEDISPHARVVDLTCNRLKTLDPTCVSNLMSLTEVQSLSFRQNLLKDVQGLAALGSATVLQRLELRDNQIEELPRDFSRFTALRYLECSYNHIEDMSALETLPSGNLESLYLAQNRLRQVRGLEPHTELRELELGHNKISSMRGLEHLTNIRELWLGSNRIPRVDVDLSAFAHLTKLALTSNRLTSMEGLERVTSLEELYVSDNGITELCDLSALQNLRVLDVAANKLTGLGGVGMLQRLTDLWANGNAIVDLDGVEGALEGVKETLETLYLHGNPFLEDKRQAGSYKLRMTHAFPALVQLDDTLVHR